MIMLPDSYVQPEKTTTPDAEAIIGDPSFATMSIPLCAVLMNKPGLSDRWLT